MRLLTAATITIILGLLAVSMSAVCSAESTPTPVDVSDAAGTARPLPTPQPEADVPSEVQIVPAFEPGTVIVEPTGRAKQLACAITERVKAKYPNCDVQTTVCEQKRKTRVRLVMAYPGADPVLLTYVSNCSINSQFRVSPSQFTELADPDKHEIRPNLEDQLVTLICADWTQLNHDWTDTVAVVPKKYAVTVHDKTVDISYDVRQVLKYNQVLVSKRRLDLRRVATR